MNLFALNFSTYIKYLRLNSLADGLKECMVSSYEEISAKMDEGTLNRTVASTNMNNTSSRAHTIVGITFVQKVFLASSYIQIPIPIFS